MPVYTFVEVTPLPACERTGAFMQFLADTEEAAVSACLYTCRLADGRAEIGPSRRIVYPHGLLAEGNCWVLLTPDRQRRFYEERGLPDPNMPTVGGGTRILRVLPARAISGPTCNWCHRAAQLSLQWRTPIMPASAFWYACVEHCHKLNG